MLTGSAYMRQPWGVSKIYSIDDPEYRGVRFIEPEKLYQIAKLALANDLQFTAHSQGDAAVDAMVEAYERINRDDFPVRARRPSITHASFMSREAIAKMQALGVVANLQPAWLYLDGTTLRQHFGVERLAYFHPYRTLFEQGVTVGGGSDHMQKIGSLRSINPYNPFLAMWTTIVRQPRGSKAPLHPEQALTREQAIRLYTINNAFLTFEEAQEGIARARQARRLHRARPRHPHLPGRRGEGHQGRGDLPWRRARLRAAGGALSLAARISCQLSASRFPQQTKDQRPETMHRLVRNTRSGQRGRGRSTGVRRTLRLSWPLRQPPRL